MKILLLFFPGSWKEFAFFSISLSLTLPARDIKKANWISKAIQPASSLAAHLPLYNLTQVKKEHNIMVIIGKRFQIFRFEENGMIKRMLQWGFGGAGAHFLNGILFRQICLLIWEEFLHRFYRPRDNDQHFIRLWAIIQGSGIVESSIHRGISREKCIFMGCCRVWLSVQLAAQSTKWIH